MEGRNTLARRTRVNSDPLVIKAVPPHQGRFRLFVSRWPTPRTHSDPSCDVLWTCAYQRLQEQQVHAFPPLTPARTHLIEFREPIVDVVDPPTRSDSGSLAKDTDDAGPKAIVTNVDLSEGLVNVASAALERYDIESVIAAQIRTEFDKRHGPT